MQNLIPCRFHIEVEAVLKSEGLRATKQRLNIWDELCSTIIIVTLKPFFMISKRKLMFQEPHYIEQLMYL